MFEFPKWLRKCNFYFMRVLNNNSEDTSEWHDAREEHQVSTWQEANLIGSQFSFNNKGEVLHKVFIDLDTEHLYIPSSTEGHGHLYVNVNVTTEQLNALNKTLAETGVVGKGWAYQSELRGENTFRMPWCKKQEPFDDLGDTNEGIQF